MSPDLIAALGRLGALTASELALVGATASSLAGQGGGVATLQPAVLPRPTLRQETIRDHAPVLSRPGVRRVTTERTGRSMFLGTVPHAFCDAVDPDLFSSAAYQTRLGRTTPSLLYVAGNRGGLTALAGLIGQSVYKVGITGAETSSDRMATLAACRYGSCVRRDGRWIEEPGFAHFEAAGLPLPHRRAAMSPVRNALGGIAVDRPLSLSLATLDKQVRDALMPISLNAFARGPDGHALCAARGFDPATLDRHTPAVTGRSSRTRPRRASELVVGLGPRAAAAPLADLLERIIADHVMENQP